MWTLGTLVWMPIFVLLMLIGVTLLVILHIVQTNDRTTKTSERRPYYDYDPGGYRIVRGITIVAMVLLVAGTALGMYPYKAEYHQWQEKDCTITEISKRLVGDGDVMQEKFVVVFEGSGQQYGCLDTRCALLGPGDYLKLACKRQWDYGSTDGYDCKFREAREAGQ